MATSNIDTEGPRWREGHVGTKDGNGQKDDGAGGGGHVEAGQQTDGGE